MNITDGQQTTGIQLRQAQFPQGPIDARLIKAEIVKNCNTQYGQNDGIEFTYLIVNGVSEVEKKERIYVSQAKNSKCMQVLHELYGQVVPKQIKLQQHINRKCRLMIQHKADEIGNIYDNIVARKFY